MVDVKTITVFKPCIGDGAREERELSEISDLASLQAQLKSMRATEKAAKRQARVMAKRSGNEDPFPGIGYIDVEVTVGTVGAHWWSGG